MKPVIASILILVGAAACSMETRGFSQSQDCTSQWQAWSQKPGDEGAFPDSHVSYFRYTFEVPKGRKIAFRVTAKYPVGRYMGFNIYNTAKMDSLAGIADFEINPDEGFENPYRSGEAAPDARYTLWMNPHEPAIHQSIDGINNPRGNLRNEQPDSEAERKIFQREIWYRIYDPTDGPGGNGRTELPKVEAVDQETGLPVECPTPALIPVPKGEFDWGRMWAAPPGPDSKGNLHFVHHQGMGLYANRDTDYVAARLKLIGASDEVVILKFRAPKSAHSIGDLKDPSRIDVRYWSFCIGAAVTTVTTECLVDRNARVDGDGFVKIVIAPPSLREIVQDANFMVRPLGMMPVLIYRNLIPRADFPGSFSKVPLWRSRLPFVEGADEYAADKFIGEYAPVGKVCSVDQYKINKCGE